MIQPSPADLWTAYHATRSFADRNALIVHYLSYARHHANLASKPGRDADDLHQDAARGLMQAVEMYDPSRGTAFSSYSAQRIRGAIYDGMRDRDRLSRTMRRRGAAPTTRSLDGIDATAFQDAGQPRPHQQIAAASLRGFLMRGLTPTEQLILTLRYVEDMDQVQIAKVIGLHASRISQILGQLLARLRGQFDGRQDELLALAS